MLEMAILGLLHDSPMHGYDLRKQLKDLLGPFRAFSYGSLYPALRHLETERLIYSADGGPPPAARSTRANAAPVGTKRAKRVYEITPEGRERFIELVSDTGPRNYTDDGFGLRLAFSASPHRRCACASSKAVAGRWSSDATPCARPWRKPAPACAGTVLSCNSWRWSPLNAKWDGSTSSSPLRSEEKATNHD